MFQTQIKGTLCQFLTWVPSLMFPSRFQWLHVGREDIKKNGHTIAPLPLFSLSRERIQRSMLSPEGMGWGSQYHPFLSTQKSETSVHWLPKTVFLYVSAYTTFGHIYICTH